jgi:hypothetical protein
MTLARTAGPATTRVGQGYAMALLGYDRRVFRDVGRGGRAWPWVLTRRRGMPVIADLWTDVELT